MKLAVVPSSDHPLSTRANTAGLVILKTDFYRQRYTGSKRCAVDINGNFWDNRTELLKHCGEEYLRFKGQKKGPLKKAARKKAIVNHLNGPENTKKLSTPKKRFSTLKEKLLTQNTEKTFVVHKSEVRRRLLTMIQTKKGKKELYFWTITFPKNIPDTVAYHAYNIWLTALRQKKYLRGYLWIAERQQNGTVHFHIAIPHKMSVQMANRLMMVTLCNLQKEGVIDYNIHFLKRYNGVDIAKNRNTKRVTNFAIKKGGRSLAVYLTKYVTKNDAKFSHLAWHNSREFSALFTGVTFTRDEIFANGWHRQGVIDKTKRHETEHFVFVPWYKDPPDKLIRHLAELNDFVLEQISAN